MADLERTFGEHLTVVELQPFTLKETQALVEALTGGTEVIPARSLPVVHRLTRGQPIFLHLVVDLLQVLSPEPRAILDLFDQYADLVSAPEDDERLVEAREQIEREILRGVCNESGDLGGYLSRLALMPKGVDADVLHESLGIPEEEAKALLGRLDRLSFVKRYKAPAGAERLHSEHLFLHDEMYRLLAWPGVMPSLLLNERMVAHALVVNYYEKRIAQLEHDIVHEALEQRVALRERLQKLQVERLYYLLAYDPCRGYAEYKHLSDQANRQRWVGFSMRLLDEFLRFYNTPRRRRLFETAGISPEMVIRESTQLWVERFHWWGQYQREVQFARDVLDKPEVFSVRPEDVAIRGNICALWGRARGMLHGYEPQVMKELQDTLACFPPLADCTVEQTLAYARLATSIGYQLRHGGMLTQAASKYVDAGAAFRKLEDNPPDELAILLNNLALVYALQGHMALARPLAHEALRLNEKMGNEYSTGLTLVILAAIERMRGNYTEAVAYGEEALTLFRDLEDAHGMMLAHVRIGYAKRKMVKHKLEEGRKLEEVGRLLEEALTSLTRALEIAEEAGLESNIPDLLAEQGRIHRERGRLINRLEGFEKGQVDYRQSERLFGKALKTKTWPVVDRANTLQDLAEILFLLGDDEAAEDRLAEVEALIGREHRLVPGEQAPPVELPTEYFAPLGKVEMTRGQISFARGQFTEGLRHFVLAYAYFVRFSPEAGEKDTLLEYLYTHLREFPIDRQRSLMVSVRTWVQEYDIGVDIYSFVQALESLIGV